MAEEAKEGESRRGRRRRNMCRRKRKGGTCVGGRGKEQEEGRRGRSTGGDTSGFSKITSFTPCRKGVTTYANAKIFFKLDWFHFGLVKTIVFYQYTIF